MKHKTALVLAGGAFGTSIAFVLTQNFENVIIKVRDQSNFDEINAGENKTYLPGQKLPPSIRAELSWNRIPFEDIELIVSGLPMAAIDPFCVENNSQLTALFEKGIPLVNLAKGIDHETLKLPDEIFNSHFDKYRNQIIYLSGPSFAKEIVDKQITMVTIAGSDRENLLKVCQMMSTDFFKPFPTLDIKGVLLGGALKNVIAIAGGIMEGLGYNHNTRAALITRGITEMLRFGVKFGARPETFYGPSGMGDLILTTTGELSRNKSFGMELAKGRTADEIIASSKSVVEGYKTAKAAYLLAKKYNIRARIFAGLYHVLYDGLDPKEVLAELMKLPPRFDDDN